MNASNPLLRECCDECRALDDRRIAKAQLDSDACTDPECPVWH